MIKMSDNKPDRWYDSELKYIGIAAIIAASSLVIRGCNEDTRIVCEYNMGKYDAIVRASGENLQTLIKEIEHDDRE